MYSLDIIKQTRKVNLIQALVKKKWLISGLTTAPHIIRQLLHTSLCYNNNINFYIGRQIGTSAGVRFLLVSLNLNFCCTSLYREKPGYRRFDNPETTAYAYTQPFPTPPSLSPISQTVMQARRNTNRFL